MNKSMSELGIDFSTGYIPGKIGEKALNSLTPHLQNKVEDNLLNTVMSIPRSVFGKGIEKAVKELKQQGATLFLLGCTELSTVSHRIRNIQEVFVDPLEILAYHAIVEGGCIAREV